MEIDKPKLTLEAAADIVYTDLPDPFFCYCHVCDETYGREEMTEDIEPHGEITLLCPKGHHEIT